MAIVLGIKCLNCEQEYEELPLFEGCPNCKSETFSSNLILLYDYVKMKKNVSETLFHQPFKGLWSFKELLPVKEENIVTLHEGGTPFLKSTLGKEWGVENLYLKDETRNPTHSFKDRLAAVSISKAKELGANTVVVSSTGNHGAATAAYAAKAGLECIIFTTKAIPKAMNVLMQVYGAKVVALSESFERWTIMKKCIDQFNWFPISNYVYPPVGSNFYGIEGYKTIAFEICADLEWKVPDKVVVPTAYGDGLSGIWRGFKELFHLGVIDRLPEMIAVEMMGSLKNTLDYQQNSIKPMKRKPTIAYSMGTPISTFQALKSIRESKGQAIVAEDKDLINMQIKLAQTGIYAEASSVASLVAIKKMSEQQQINHGEVVVSLITSTGLKDYKVTRNNLRDIPIIEPNIGSLKRELANGYDYKL